jgi:hypothetical protein
MPILQSSLLVCSLKLANSSLYLSKKYWISTSGLGLNSLLHKLLHGGLLGGNLGQDLRLSYSFIDIFLSRFLFNSLLLFQCYHRFSDRHLCVLDSLDDVDLSLGLS